MPEPEAGPDAARLIEALEHLPDSVCIVSPVRDESGEIVDLVVEYVNRAAEDTVGLARDEVVGKRLLEATPAVRDSGLLDNCRQVIETGEPYVGTIEYRDDGDDRRPVEGTFEIKMAKFGDGVLSIYRNVTERTAEEALRVAEVERQVAARARSLQRVTDAALAHLRRDDLLDELLTRVADELHADSAAVLLLDPEDDLLAARGATDPSVTIEVPLLAGERVLGVLQVGWLRKRRPRPDEIDLLHLAADRAALAIEHARVYERERETADTLQHSLLPERLPKIPGVAIAARYRAAGERFQVGGDFYDAFEVADGRWLLVIGDVCGKGPEAATLTALARYTLRAEAMREPRPAELLGLLNDAIVRQRSDGRFCTAVCVSIDVRDSDLVVTLASGGHPLPMLLRADGSVQEVGHHGTLLGIVAEVDLEDVRLELAPGDILVLYTDGVIEVDAPEKVLEPAELAELVSGCAGLDPGALARRLEREVLGDGEPRDDLAIVAVGPVRAGEAASATDPSSSDAAREPIHPEAIPPSPPTPPASAGSGPAPGTAGAATAPAERDPPVTPPLALWIPATNDAPKIARHAARRSVRLRGRALETVDLLLTELVTNSVRHGELGPRDLVSVRIEESPSLLRCEVGDSGPGPPAGRAAARRGGIGLLLVDELADRWGIDHDATGTRVWFEIQR